MKHENEYMWVGLMLSDWYVLLWHSLLGPVYLVLISKLWHLAAHWTGIWFFRCRAEFQESPLIRTHDKPPRSLPSFLRVGGEIVGLMVLNQHVISAFVGQSVIGLQELNSKKGVRVWFHPFVWYIISFMHVHIFLSLQ
jgi:hypothetical protein